MVGIMQKFPSSKSSVLLNLIGIDRKWYTDLLGMIGICQNWQAKTSVKYNIDSYATKIPSYFVMYKIWKDAKIVSIRDQCAQ